MGRGGDQVFAPSSHEGEVLSPNPAIARLFQKTCLSKIVLSQRTRKKIKNILSCAAKKKGSISRILGKKYYSVVINIKLYEA